MCPSKQCHFVALQLDGENVNVKTLLMRLYNFNLYFVSFRTQNHYFILMAIALRILRLNPAGTDSGLTKCNWASVTFITSILRLDYLKNPMHILYSPLRSLTGIRSAKLSNTECGQSIDGYTLSGITSKCLRPSEGT